MVRVVAYLAAGDIGHLFIEQFRQPAQNAALRLAAQSKEDEVLLREHRVDYLRHDRIFISHNTGKDGLLGLKTGDQVLAQLVFDAASFEARFVELFAALQLTQSLRKRRRHKFAPWSGFAAQRIRPGPYGSPYTIRPNLLHDVSIAARNAAGLRSPAEFGQHG